MELGVIGLGRMGQIVVDRVLDAGHDVVAFDIDEEAVADAADAGARPADSIGDLAESLGDAEVIEFPTQPANQVAVEITNSNGDAERWMFRQGSSDWAGLVKEGWWLDKAEQKPIYRNPDDDSGVRISLYHRLEQNRNKAVENRTLELKLWHGTSNGDEFMHDFKDRIAAKIEHHANELPATTETTGRRGGPVALSYEIRVGDYDDFFDAYTAALHDAFLDIVIEHPKLITLIDDAFEESLATYE